MAKSVNIRAGHSTTTAQRLRQGDKVVPIFAPEGGLALVTNPANLISQKRLCELTELSAIEAEFVNEAEAFNLGKERVTVFDYVQFSGSFTMEGDALETIATLNAQDLHNKPMVEYGQYNLRRGHLILLSGDKDLQNRTSTIILDVNIRLGSAPGGTDGNSDTTVEFDTKSRVISFPAGMIPIKEVFYDGPSPANAAVNCVNAAAPDGALTTFKTGQGNLSGLGTDAVLAVDIDPDTAGYANMLSVRLDGIEQDQSLWSYNSATGVLTFTSAPADGALLEIIYVVRGGAKEWVSNRTYGVGEYVEYNGDYFVALQVHSSATPPTVGANWAAAVFGQTSAPADINTPLIPFTDPAGAGFMLNSWTDIQSL